MKQKYTEGTWFSIPLESGKFAVGVVARKTPRRGRVLFGYFFGPARIKKPVLSDLSDYRPTDAVGKWIFGDLGLINGRWPIIGEFDGWDRTNWAMPVFVRNDPLAKTSYEVEYIDDDPNGAVTKTRIPFDPNPSNRDAMRGFGAVEIELGRLLQ